MKTKSWIVYVMPNLNVGGGNGTVEDIVPEGATYSVWSIKEDAMAVFLSFLRKPRPMPVIDGVSFVKV